MFKRCREIQSQIYFISEITSFNQEVASSDFRRGLILRKESLKSMKWTNRELVLLLLLTLVVVPIAIESVLQNFLYQFLGMACIPEH